MSVQRIKPGPRMSQAVVHGNTVYLQGLTADDASLDVKGQTVESLVTALGTRVSYAVNTSIGVFMPTVHADWRHEALNGRRNIKAQFLNDPSNTIFFIPTDDPDRDYFALGAGVSATFRKGLAAFLEYEGIVGLRDITNHNFTAGIRLEF